MSSRRSFDQFDHQLLLDSIPHVVWVSDPRGYCLYMNRLGLQLLGVSEDHIKGAEWQQLLHADDASPVLSAWRRATAEGEPYRIEFRVRQPDASYRWCLGQAIRIGDADIWVGTWTDIDDRHQAEDQLRALSARLRSAREEEGVRIARELHDELGGSLSAIKWELERLAALPEAGLIAASLRSVVSSVDENVAAVQRIASELRPSMLDDLGLVDAIEWHAHDFERRTRIPCDFVRTGPADVSFEPAVATAIFRIFQEALTNVLRHAQATIVDVCVDTDDRGISLRVIDDGCGYDSTTGPAPGLGLIGMQERVALINGSLHLVSSPGKGTEVRVWAPRSPSDGAS